MNEPADPVTGDALKERFDSLVGEQLWEVDGEENLLTSPVEEPCPDDSPLSPPTQEAEFPESPSPEPSPPEDETPPSPLRIVEAMLFVGGAPLTPERAGEIVRGLEPTAFRDLIDELNRNYRRQARPYAIRETEKGFVLDVRANFRAVAERFTGSPKEARLNQPAVDVAALIAYQQPIAKSEIDALRGTDSAGPIRQLVRLGLVAVARRGDGQQKEVFYGTTSRFLQVFGLGSLDDLPKMANPA